MPGSSKKDLVVGTYILVALNIFFAALAVIGQVSQNVSLPLWTGATSALGNPNCTSNNINKSQLFEEYYKEDHESSSSLTSSNNGSSNNTSSFQPGMDPFFVLSFASLSFLIIFGVITAGIVVVQVIANYWYGDTVLEFITKEEMTFSFLNGRCYSSVALMLLMEYLLSLPHLLLARLRSCRPSWVTSLSFSPSTVI